MSTTSRPKLRSAPSPEDLARRNAASLALVEAAVGKRERLEKLNDWTETPVLAPAVAPISPEREPSRAVARRNDDDVPPEPVMPTVVVSDAKVVVKRPAREAEALEPVATTPPPEKPKKQWEEPSEKETHPYHIIMQERLFQKLDFVWKRQGSKSMKDYILKTLENQVEKELRDLGEIE